MEELYENQWSDGRGGWRDRWSPECSDDAAPGWSNLAANLGLHPEGLEPPTGYKWAAPTWRIDTGGGDEQGWRYGPSLSQCVAGGPVASTRVRRRRWQRPYVAAGARLGNTTPRIPVGAVPVVTAQLRPPGAPSATRLRAASPAVPIEAAAAAAGAGGGGGAPPRSSPPPVQPAYAQAASTIGAEEPRLDAAVLPRQEHKQSSPNPFSNGNGGNPFSSDGDRSTTAAAAVGNGVAASPHENASCNTILVAASTSTVSASTAGVLRNEVPASPNGPPHNDEAELWRALRASLPHRNPTDCVSMEGLNSDVVAAGALIVRLRQVVQALRRQSVSHPLTAGGGDSTAAMLRTLAPMVRETRTALAALQRCMAFNASRDGAVSTATNLPVLTTPGGNSFTAPPAGLTSAGLRKQGGTSVAVRRGAGGLAPAGRSAFDAAASATDDDEGAPSSTVPVSAASSVAPRWNRLKGDCASLLRAFDAEAATLAALTQRLNGSGGSSGGGALKQQIGGGASSFDYPGSGAGAARLTLGGGGGSSSVSDEDLSLAQLSAQVEFNASLIEERNAEIDIIATESVAVAELFRDLSALVMEQGEGIATIARNAEAARDATAAGVENLRAADRSHASATPCVVM